MCKNEQNMIMDFITAAMPFITCGLMVALSAVSRLSENSGKEEKNGRFNSYHVTAILWFMTAILTMTSSDTSSYTVYLCLGAFMLCLGEADKKRKSQEEKE